MTTPALSSAENHALACVARSVRGRVTRTTASGLGFAAQVEQRPHVREHVALGVGTSRRLERVARVVRPSTGEIATVVGVVSTRQRD
jgi:hypothetical protein